MSQPPSAPQVTPRSRTGPFVSLALGGAIRLAQLAKAAGKTLNITVIEKAKEVGAHTCSGAVMDPRSLRELIPDFEAQGAPIESPVEEDLMYFMTAEEAGYVTGQEIAIAGGGELLQLSLGRSK
jgi:flavin-dependent dehydrogenase